MIRRSMSSWHSGSEEFVVEHDSFTSELAATPRRRPSNSRTRSRAGHLKSMHPRNPRLSGASCSNHRDPSAPITTAAWRGDGESSRHRHHRSTTASVTITTSPSVGPITPTSKSAMSSTSTDTPRTSRSSSARTSAIVGLDVTMLRCMKPSPPPERRAAGIGVIGDVTSTSSRLLGHMARIQMSSAAVTRLPVFGYFVALSWCTTTTVLTWT